MVAGFNSAKRGEYLGISTSITSLALIIGPLITTATFDWNPYVPFIVGAIIVMVGYIMLKKSKMLHVV